MLDAELVTFNHHSEFLRELHQVNDDGEVIYSSLKSSYRDKNRLTALEYKYRGASISGPTLEIFISSKALGARYFEGINKDTISIIYDAIIKEGVVSMTKDAFLASRVRDIDFCRDEYLEKTTVASVVSYCRKLVRPTTQANLGCNVFTKKENKGIEFGKREKVGSAYKTKQFLKFYAKALELLSRSQDFYKEFIEPNLITIDTEGEKSLNKFFDPERLIRIETTIKNRAHFSTYGLRVETLKDALLLLEPEHRLEVAEFFNRPINTHMVSRRFVSPEAKSKLRPTDRALLLLLNSRAAELKRTAPETIPFLADELFGGYGSAPEVSRMKAKLFKLYDAFERPQSVDPDVSQKSIYDELAEIDALSLAPKPIADA